MLFVGLLGVFRVANVDARDWAQLGPSGRGLASYLFTYPDRPHRRARVQSLFWPQLDEDRSRSALNSAVWRLRKVLAPHEAGAQKPLLNTIGQEIVLASADWCEIDALVLQSAAQSAAREPLTLAAPVALDRLLAVLNDYKGPFLDGDEGDWILEERERLHSIFVRTAIQAACLLAGQRRYPDAAGLAAHALRFDPYREELVRIFLAVLTLNEQRAKALCYFEAWSRALAAELQIMPLPTTVALARQIRTLHTDEQFQDLHRQFFGSTPK